VRQVAGSIRFLTIQSGSVLIGFFFADSVRNLGIYLDSDASMRVHVSKTVSNCFAALRQIRSIRRCVPRQVLVSLVVSLVLSRLDYGNATLAGLPVYLIDRLQSVVNAAARLVNPVGKFEHVTPLYAIFTGSGLVKGSSLNWQCWCTAASTVRNYPTLPVTSIALPIWTLVGVSARLPLTPSPASPLLATALVLWRRLGCGTAYLPV